MESTFLVKPQPMNLSLAKLTSRSFGCAPVGCLLPLSGILGFWAAAYWVGSRVPPALVGQPPAKFDWDTWLPLAWP